MDPGREIIHVLALAGGLILILGIGELIHRTFPKTPEFSRKSVHFLSGCTALSFPYLIHSHWYVLLLAVAFSFLVFASNRWGVLKSIHDVDRRSHGAVYFPFAVYGLFLLSSDRPTLYFVAMLVLTVSDSLAALLGGRYGRIRYEVEGTTKTLEGSMVFFFVTFLCVHLPLLFMTWTDDLSTVLIALVIAMLVTGFEAISVGGSDNLVIPFGTYFLLEKMIALSFDKNFELLWMLLVMIMITVPLVKKTRLFKPSAFIGMILVNYAAWVLADFLWLLPLLLAQGMLALLVRHFAHRVEEEITAYQIKVLLYSVFIPTILIFASTALQDEVVVYVPYVASITAQVGVIFYFFTSVMVDADGRMAERTATIKVVTGMLCGLTSTLVIGAVPIILSAAGSKAMGLFLTITGVWVSIGIFEFLSMRYHLKEHRVLRQKMRLYSVALGTLAVFGLQHMTAG